MTIRKSRTPRVLPTFEGCALDLKAQARMGITEQLAAAGGSMSRHRLFNIRRNRKGKESTGRWVTAMLQLLGNGIVEQTGTGKRGDPFTVRLVKPLPEGP